MNKIVLVLTLYLLLAFGLFGQKPKIERIEPPNWWIGMHSAQVQLLLYGENLKNGKVSTEYSGLEVTEVSSVFNPNYLFVNLRIGDFTQPGIVHFTVENNGKKRQFRYELKKRFAPEGRYQGINSQDLIYLIMPDRFANGDPGNDVIKGMRETHINRDSMYHRHGGDLDGIIAKLDYLSELGVTALWLNPILENDMPKTSYHGYAATDLYKVDPRFGTNEKYVHFVEECHKRGMKVIMDIIHNHVGSQHWLINDLPEEDWSNKWPNYTRTSYRAPTVMDPHAAESDRKIMTDGWFDEHMPDLNQRNEHLATYLLQNNIWWIETTGLDGFRLDTYAYSDKEFTAEWAKVIFDNYPGFGMFGETWVHGAPIQAYFTQNSQFDPSFNSHLPGVTDFQLYYALNHALTNEFGWTEGLNRLYYTLAKDFIYEDANRNVIFLDNHDLSRYFSMIGEDLESWKMGIAFLMTTRGIPMIYYGTEILMKNFSDPDGKVREDFPGGWQQDRVNKFEEPGRTKQENDAWQYFRKLATWRKNNHAVTEGKLTQFVPDEGVYVFFRHLEKKTVMVIMNQNEVAKTFDNQRFKERTLAYSHGHDVVSGKDFELRHLDVPARTTLVLELRSY